MGLLALILLTVWATGIVIMTAAIAYTLKTSQDVEMQQARLLAEQRPGFFYTYISFIIVFWPAYGLYLWHNAATKGK